MQFLEYYKNSEMEIKLYVYCTNFIKYRKICCNKRYKC